MFISHNHINGIEVLTGENDYIKFETVPEAGGKIISIYNKKLQKEFLWKNTNMLLKTHKSGDDYDANFLGGIDELIPNDVPETINGIHYPDHGELWTTILDYELMANKISLFGKLEFSGIYYKKIISMEADSPVINIDYTIRNETLFTRNFLWKLHAALAIEEGDKLVSNAKTAKVVDHDYSRFKRLHEFEWPFIENNDASVVPGKNNTVDFFYLYNIEKGEMDMVSGSGSYLFRYSYDKNIFPYQWYFASYGGFLNHYTTILEPSTGMPIIVNEAKESGQCSVLEPGEEMNTFVKIYAGENV